GRLPRRGAGRLQKAPRPARRGPERRGLRDRAAARRALSLPESPRGARRRLEDRGPGAPRPGARRDRARHRLPPRGARPTAPPLLRRRGQDRGRSRSPATAARGPGPPVEPPPPAGEGEGLPPVGFGPAVLERRKAGAQLLDRLRID